MPDEDPIAEKTVVMTITGYDASNVFGFVPYVRTSEDDPPVITKGATINVSLTPRDPTGEAQRPISGQLDTAVIYTPEERDQLYALLLKAGGIVAAANGYTLIV